MIDYFRKYYNITAEDEVGTILALKQHDRVRCVRLLMPLSNLQRLIVAMDEEYPILEWIIAYQTDIEDRSTNLTFPGTLQAPHLRQLVPTGFALPMGSRLLTTAVGLAALCLLMDHPPTYFHPGALLQSLSFMPQLETLMIVFSFAVLNHDVEMQPTLTPTTTPVALPKLHHLRFGGASSYLEALVHQITSPFPEKLEIYFFNQLTFSFPRLQQFMTPTETPRFESAKFDFSSTRVELQAYLRGKAEVSALFKEVDCRQLDWQVSSVAQISSSLSQVFSAVEHLTLEHSLHSRSSEEHNEVGLTEWRKLLRSSRNVKAIRIDNGLVEGLSRCLELDVGELLPSYRSSHILEVAMAVMHLLHSSMLARTRVIP